MPNITRRSLLIAAAVLLLTVALALGVRQLMFAPKPVEYLIAKVVRSDLESAVMATGTLQAYKQVDVGAQVSGQLKSLRVQLGEHVTRGQLLAEIDPVLPENALRSAKASLDSLDAQKQAAQASLWQAELAYQRQQDMIRKEATSRQEVEAAKAQMQVIKANIASFEAQIRQSRTQVDSAQASLAYTRIIAPMDGEVVAIVTQEGQTVVASQQAPVILKLANLDQMTVRAQVSEADVMRIGIGFDAYFTILGNAQQRFTGKLRAIEPGPQDFTGTNNARVPGPVFYNALFDVPNPSHALRIAMTAQVGILLGQARNVLSIPASALGARDDKGRYAVRVMDAGKNIRTVAVGTGINNNVRVEVTGGLKEGLNEGDSVIIDEAPGRN
jgi:macrolide-specific efflux system membrane fusion protein